MLLRASESNVAKFEYFLSFKRQFLNYEKSTDFSILFTLLIGNHFRIK